ncbi:inositol 1,4,5-triphosphate receptor associated 2 isoform X1 [Conger conger]|uniref:inositol 1,4,5-triphosphate receptor associated 2 isoform X1 n=1 Tax=Conger conger TaxID=82655 RepID=UPI002A599C1B|nr:inositol 1,4,5-triphosphate receptor associated 2 isoform X1 [Conger conger]
MDVGVMQRRHNPVDSICRKLQTIQRWTQEGDSPFQIPRFQSSSYDSPQSGLRGNLEAILKRRAVRGDGSESEGSPGMTPTSSPWAHCPTRTPLPNNTTYTISSTLGERRNTGQRPEKPWSRSCSTPAALPRERFFNFSPCATYSRPDGGAVNEDRRGNPAQGMHAYYNLNFCTSDTSAILDSGSDPGFPALVVKRLSMGDGLLDRSEHRKETMAEVSLICEEDLLDTIFYTCDTQRRGRVCVSHIVDYLRHTTSRGSEDSGLEELCNMLDPDRKDVSIDLATYHAIMKEWIQDCRNQGDDTPEELLQSLTRDSLSGKRAAVLNMTSGSLEAFGGEASRGDLETSDLVYCVADLQFNNQKLQDEVRKMKQAMETMEELNQKLTEENEGLKSQAKMCQHLAQKEKLLKEEMEEMKATLGVVEESRTQATAQVKQMERENHGLIMKISSLQEENIKMTQEIDDLQKKMIELCDLNADLQVQVHSFDGILHDRESCVREKCRQIEELKGVIEEYSSVTELLRAEKTKLENQMQMMQPDVAAAGLSLSVAYRLNQTTSGSLQAELAIAQSSERISSLSFASPLDETLDREVLLLLQGPTPEQMSIQFKNILSKLDEDFKEDCSCVLSRLKQLLEAHSGLDPSTEQDLKALQSELEQKRKDWGRSLQQVDQYTNSLERELIKMASNMRRSRTEILHLSVRVQEQENQRHQLQEELERLQAPLPEGREASAQTEELQQQVIEEESEGPSLGWEEDCIPQISWKEEKSNIGREDEQQSSFRSPQEHQLNFSTEEQVELKSRTEEQEQSNSNKEEGVSDFEGNQFVGSTHGDEDRGISGCDRHGMSESRGEGEGEDLKDSKHSSFPSSWESPPGQSVNSEELDGTDTQDADLSVHSEPTQEADGLPGCTGPQDSQHVPDLSQTPLVEALNPDPGQPHHTSSAQDLSLSPGHVSSEQDLSLSPGHVSSDHDPAISPGHPRPEGDLTTLPELTEPQQGKMIPPLGQTCLVSACTQGERGRGGSPEDVAASNMTEAKKWSLGLPYAVTLQSVNLQSVPEEEQVTEEAVQVSPEEARMAGAGRQAGGGGSPQSLRGSPQVEDGQTETSTDVSEQANENEALNSSFTDDGLSPLLGSQNSRAAKKDCLTLRSKFKRELELSGSMEAIEEQKTQEELSQGTEKEDGTPLNSEDTASDSMKEDKNSLSPSDKEVEGEFHRLSLGFKCDMFTLEKRLRLEERSRDLAEDNLKKEVTNCQGLLQTLLPLCEEDNKSMEIITRLQKNLDILIQSMSRVSSRSEMLGAIHQESRVSRAVEVMIQHVENLRRMYTKEHAELMELRETLVQNERSFGSSADRDDFRNKKVSGSQYYKPSSRRVSIAVIPRNSGGAVHFDMPKSQEMAETEVDSPSRRSSWPQNIMAVRHRCRNMTGKSSQQPCLNRFLSTCAWTEKDDPPLMKGPVEKDSQSEEEKKEPNRDRRSSITELGSRIKSLLSSKIHSPDQAASRPEDAWPSLRRRGRVWWVPVVMVVLLAAFLAMLASLALQPSVDAAPVGTGDSWMTIQQLLWPYTGLRHNGQPPV